MVCIERNAIHSEGYMDNLIMDFEQDGWEIIRDDDYNEIYFRKGDIFIGVDPDENVYVMNKEDYEEIRRMG